MWDHSSPPRHWTLTAQSLHHQTARKIPRIQFLSQSFPRPGHGVERGGREDPVYVWTSMWLYCHQDPLPRGQKNKSELLQGSWENFSRTLSSLHSECPCPCLALWYLVSASSLPVMQPTGHTFILGSTLGADTALWALGCPWALLLLFAMPLFNNLAPGVSGSGPPTVPMCFWNHFLPCPRSPILGLGLF